MLRKLLFLCLLGPLSLWPAKSSEIDGAVVASGKRGLLPNPILFVTQVPIPENQGTIASTFANHVGRISLSGRGGDLWIYFPDDGLLKNLTASAGFGEVGHQGEGAIGVRDPAVHWDGDKALFSMIIGAPPQFQHLDYFWQLYEITGLGKQDTPVITKVPHQPENYNNVMGTYGSDDRIIFVSDRPRDGQRHLWPLLDEYEEAPTPTGLWSLDPGSGDLFMLNHTPSGAFTPIVDSEGRVIFTRWDHLQRDQQADADALSPGGAPYGTFNYADETEQAERLETRQEVFPEPRPQRTDLLAGTPMVGHRFNRFLPWQIHQDGTEEEVLNHIGRHELWNYFERSFNDDPNLIDFVDQVSGRTNTNAINNFFQLREDPQVAGRFIGVDAPEFDTNAAGQLIATYGPGQENPDDMAITYLTHRETATPWDGQGTPPADHSGMYRNPIILTDGSILAAHTAEILGDENLGTREFPQPRYDFRLKIIEPQGDIHLAGDPLTAGLSKSLTYWDPDFLVHWDGPLWELSPVEVVARPRPNRPESQLPAVENGILADEGVDIRGLKAFMMARQTALVVSRDVTTRDAADRQQPYNLHIDGSPTQSVGAPGKIYDLKYIQFFQADRIRGLGGTLNPRPGRRVLAQPLHDPAADNPPTSGPQGSANLAADGSMAAFLPARRAMTWQLTAPDATPVVRERFWLTFQPGEIRVCASCHGVNHTDQQGQPPPENPPEALRTLLRYWKEQICQPGPTELDGNGRWDVRDGILLMNAVGQTPPHPHDLDCSGWVGPEDLLLAAQNWPL